MNTTNYEQIQYETVSLEFPHALLGQLGLLSLCLFSCTINGRSESPQAETMVCWLISP